MTWRISFLWILCNYAYTYSVMYSNITSLMVLNNSTPVWTWMLCLTPMVPVALREEFQLTKGLMVWLLIIGFSIISYADNLSAVEQNSNANVMGNTSCLMSAFLYAVYSLFLKASIPEEREKTFKFSYLLGCIGLFNLVALLPVLLGLHFSGIEEFHMPTQRVWLLLFASSFMGNFLFDYCFMRSIALLGPLVANLGCCLSFPVSLAVDLFAFDKKFSWLYFIGSACVFTSFGVIMFTGTKTSQHAKMPESDKSNQHLET